MPQLTTVLEQAIQEHEFTQARIRALVIMDQICMGEEEDVGLMLLYLRHLSYLLPESFLLDFFPPLVNCGK